jgi:hypothetical protein
MREVTLQELSDCGLNPFALQLLMESWQRHPNPKPVAFLLRGLPIALGYDPCAMQAEIDRLKKLLDRDHTGLAAALVSVQKTVRSWGWIADGEWGSYEYHERSEEALRQEVDRCFDEITKTAQSALRESGTRAGAAFVPERDQLAAAQAQIATLRAALEKQERLHLMLARYLETYPCEALRTLASQCWEAMAATLKEPTENGHGATA